LATIGHRRKVLVLVGAGSAVFTRAIVADLVSASDLGSWELRLVDVDEQALDLALRLAQRMVAARSREGEVVLDGTTDRRTALPGADFIVSCIGVGGRAAWEADWQIARRYGVLQAVGDSVLPGGLSRAMRTVPVLVELAEDVRRLAPKARFFNYSNPMTANCAAVRHRTGVEVVGLCHGVFSTHHQLARFIGKAPEETSILFCGINHLTFVYDFRWRGEDAWPLVHRRLAEDRALPIDEADIGRNHNDGNKASFNPFSFELFDRLGAYPAPGDRHTTEFFPERFGRGDYYGKTLGVDAFSLKEVIETDEERYQLMRREAFGETPLDASVFERSGVEVEQLVSVLRAILTDQGLLVSANVENRGLVPNLPERAVVEVPALVTARGFLPLAVPDFPTPLAAVILRRLAPVEVTVEAALSGSFDLFVEALLLDGAVSDPSVARSMAEDLVSAQRPYLPRFA
jgi:alpha-galactosidase